MGVGVPPPPSLFGSSQQGAPLAHLGAGSRHPRAPQPASDFGVLILGPVQAPVEQELDRPSSSPAPAGGVAGYLAPRSAPSQVGEGWGTGETWSCVSDCRT